MSERVKRVVSPILLLIALFAIWELVVRVAHVPGYILPPPSRIFATFVLRFGMLWSHTIITLAEIVFGLLPLLLVSHLAHAWTSPCIAISNRCASHFANSTATSTSQMSFSKTCTPRPCAPAWSPW